ncbi:MAG TPA: YndJ family protein [Jiangellaceae bacterium]
MTPLVGLMVAVGMLVVVPLGLRLIDDDHGRLGPIGQVWPVAGGVGAASLLLPRGGLATALASGYAAVTLWLAALALARLARRRRLDPVEIAVLTAMVTPAVAGIALVAERAGYELLGYGMTWLALTVAHFHFAGFAAALVAGLAASATGGALAGAAALSVPAGTVIVAVGFFTGDLTELVGTVVLTAGMWATGWVVWRAVRPTSAVPATRVLFAICAATPVVTMVLALGWAAGAVWPDVPHLSVELMAATHGVLNALGFGLCGVVAWRRLQAERSRRPREADVMPSA